MPRKQRTPKARTDQVSPTAMYILSDRRLYGEPEGMNFWEAFLLDYPESYPEKCGAVWKAARDMVLGDWVRKFPGSRPRCFWLFDVPLLTGTDVGCKLSAEDQLAFLRQHGLLERNEIVRLKLREAQ